MYGVLSIVQRTLHVVNPVVHVVLYRLNPFKILRGSNCYHLHFIGEKKVRLSNLCKLTVPS